MSAFIYYFVTFLESILAVFGIRAYEQPPYTVVTTLDRGVEVRDYGPRFAVETDLDAGEGEAFNRLFRYITGANDGGARIAMTAPVATSGSRIAMTAPDEIAGGRSMRFFLPDSVGRAGAPKPSDPRVRIVEVPAQTLAALRFSGSLDRARVAEKEAMLNDVLIKAGRRPVGAPILLGYDPPFTIPFLRRDEVAVALSRE